MKLTCPLCDIIESFHPVAFLFLACTGVTGTDTGPFAGPLVSGSCSYLSIRLLQMSVKTPAVTCFHLQAFGLFARRCRCTCSLTVGGCLPIFFFTLAITVGSSFIFARSRHPRHGNPSAALSANEF